MKKNLGAGNEQKTPSQSSVQEWNWKDKGGTGTWHTLSELGGRVLMFVHQMFIDQTHDVHTYQKMKPLTFVRRTPCIRPTSHPNCETETRTLQLGNQSGEATGGWPVLAVICPQNPRKVHSRRKQYPPRDFLCGPVTKITLPMQGTGLDPWSGS